MFDIETAIRFHQLSNDKVLKKLLHNLRMMRDSYSVKMTHLTPKVYDKFLSYLTEDEKKCAKKGFSYCKVEILRLEY